MCFEKLGVLFSFRAFASGSLFTAHLPSTTATVVICQLCAVEKLRVGGGHAQVDPRGLQDGEGRHRVLSLVLCLQVGEF